jgi:phytoene synthase
MRAVARRHLAQVRTLRPTISAEAMPAFRPLALVEPYLRQMERRDYDPFRTVADLPQWRRIWALWRGPL